MQFRIWLQGCLLAVAVLPQLATAQSLPPINGFYAGGGLGYTNVRAIDSDDWFSDTTYGDADFAYAVTGGYRFMRWVALEVSYVDSGEPDYDDDGVTIRGLPGRYDTDSELDIDATHVSVLGILPIADGRAEIFVKAGAAFWDADSEQLLRDITGGPDIVRDVSEDGVDFLFGFGGAINFAGNWHARLDFTTHKIDDELLALGKDDDASVETVTAQIHYRFGDNWQANW